METLLKRMAHAIAKINARDGVCLFCGTPAPLGEPHGADCLLAEAWQALGGNALPMWEESVLDVLKHQTRVMVEIRDKLNLLGELERHGDLLEQLGAKLGEIESNTFDNR